MEEDYNQQELNYKYQKSIIDPRKKAGGTGDYYTLPTSITKEQLPSSVNGISSTVYSEIDRLIDATINKGNSVLSSSDMPIKDFISKMYNIDKLSQVDINNLVNTEITNSIYGAGQILAFSRRSFECYDIAGHTDINNMDVDEPILQPYMHRAYRLYYNSSLQGVERIINSTTGFSGRIQFSTSKVYGEEETEALKQEKKVREALIWLVKHKLPVNNVLNLINTQINHYQSLLMGQIYKSINLVNHYLRLYPNLVRDGLYTARQYALKPLYEFIHKLPAFPANVDNVLVDIIVGAEKVSTEAINNIQDMLKLSEYEKFLTENHIALLNQVNKYSNIRNMLSNVGQLMQEEDINEAGESYINEAGESYINVTPNERNA